MMSRFDWNEDDAYDDEVYPYGDEDYDDEDGSVYITGDNATFLKTERELNQELIITVIKMLEKSWFWSWYTIEYKNKKIKETFEMFKSLVV